MDRIRIEVNGISLLMLPVDGGSYMMGATVEQRAEAWDNEKPIRNVTLSPYYLSETVVTQALWDAVMEDKSEASGNLPVTGKSWNEWQTFIGNLNALSGRRFRMPTEAEWENAARGGNKSHGFRFAGSNNINDVAWYDANSGSCIHPVMQKMPNELGLYDMTGNVFEWCFDKYGSYGEDPETDPIGSPTGSQRVYRGGAFSYYQRGCRISCRFCAEPTGKDYSKIGLRLAMSEGDNAPYDYQVKAPTQHPSPNKTNSGDRGGKNGSATIENGGKSETSGSTSGYWDNGNHKKKKLWPWFVGAGVAVIILIAVIANGGEKETPNGLPKEVAQPTQQKDEKERQRTEISNKIALANQMLAENRLEKYHDPTEPVQGLNKGWTLLGEADSLNLSVGDDDLDEQIKECRGDYVTHIAMFYATELDNWVGLNDKNEKEQSERRMDQVESFHGIEKVFEKVPEEVNNNLTERDLGEKPRRIRQSKIMQLLESRSRIISQ